MFWTKLFLRCNAPTCEAELEITGASNALLASVEVGREAGWFVDNRTGEHFCPAHRPDGQPSEPRP